MNQTSDWMESLDRMASVQKAKKDFHQKKAEVKLLRNASIMVCCQNDTSTFLLPSKMFTMKM